MNVTIDDRWRNVDLFWIAQRSYRIDEGRRDVCPESTSEDRDDPECYASTDRYLIEVSVLLTNLTRLENSRFQDTHWIVIGSFSK